MPFRARVNPSSISKRRHVVLPSRPTRTQASITPIRSYHTPSSIASSSTSASRYIPTPSNRPTQLRHSSTASSSSSSIVTSLKSFFTPRPSSDYLFPSDATAIFRQAILDADIPNLRRAYDVITNAIDSNPRASGSDLYLTQEDVLGGMRVLGSKVLTGGNLGVLRQWVGDWEERFGWERNEEVDRIWVKGLCDCGVVDEALGVVKQGESVGWKVLLRATSVHAPERVMEVLGLMKERVRLDEEDYTLVLGGLRQAVGRMRAQDGEKGKGKGKGRDDSQDILLGDIHGLLSEMKMQGLKVSVEREGILLNLWRRFQEYGKANEIWAGWRKRGIPGDGDDLSVWLDAVEYTVYTRKEEEVSRLCEGMVDMGIEPGAKGVVHLALKKITSEDRARLTSVEVVVRAMEEVEKDLGADASCKAWLGMLKFIPESIENTLGVYEATRRRGLPLHLDLASRTVQVLLSDFSPRINEAINVLEELYETALPHTWTNVRHFNTVREIYQIILVAIANSPDMDRGDTALKFITTMRERGMTLDGRVVCDIIGLYAQTSISHAAAFQIYANMYALDPQSLDEKDFKRIYHAFLASPLQVPLPPQYFLEILKDMYKASHPHVLHPLTSLIHRYGRQATYLASLKGVDFGSPTVETVREAIDTLYLALRLDSAIEFDVPFLNALMDAYSRCGRPMEALGVLYQLVERCGQTPPEEREVFYPTVSVALDTCGFNKLPAEAAKIWAWAGRNGLNTNVKQWNDWIECLCRLERMDLAVVTVCEEMKGGVKGAPEPNRDSLAILLQFSKNVKARGDMESVRERVKREFPEMWNEVRGFADRGGGLRGLWAARKGVEEEGEGGETEWLTSNEERMRFGLNGEDGFGGLELDPEMRGMEGDTWTIHSMDKVEEVEAVNEGRR